MFILNYSISIFNNYSMKTYKIIFLLFTVLIGILSDKAGVKTVIKLDTINEAERKFLPKFINQIGDV